MDPKRPFFQPVNLLGLAALIAVAYAVWSAWHLSAAPGAESSMGASVIVIATFVFLGLCLIGVAVCLVIWGLRSLLRLSRKNG